MDGIILCNKPTGITSNKIVRNLSKKFKIKAGNTGILDLSAEGLLIIVIGKATKFTQYFQNLDKEYIATGELGKETDTLDKNGKIVKTASISVNEKDIAKIIKSFEGKIAMIPPLYSSKKINGKRAYKYAIKKENIELKPVLVNIYNIEIIDINLPYFKIKVNCSSGTYIRSLIKLIGEKAKSFAYMYDLKRTKIGKFSIEDAKDYQYLLEIDEEKFKSLIIPINEALYFFNKIYIDDDDVKKFKNGQKIKIAKTDGIDFLNYKNNLFTKDEDNIYFKNSVLKDGDILKIVDLNDNIIGIGIREKKKIQPKIVL
ncbi:MAG: tRNA pseudouridine(55) synthase TruB [Exilispira sp.]